MAAPPIIERHLPHFHRRAPTLEPCRAATTANITIATALNSGDTLDGLTLAVGDRVLVKDQSTASQNGIYVVGATPVRAYDLSTDDRNFGFAVFVREGTANGGTHWDNTNTSAPTIDTTPITFAAAGGGTSFGTPALTLSTTNAAGAATTAIRTDATVAVFDATVPTTQALGDAAATGSAGVAARRDHKHAMPTAAVTTSGLTQATARLLGRTTASTGAVEEITVGTGLSLAAGSLTATSGTTFGTPAIVLGTAAANGSIDEAIRRDSTIVAFDATAPTNQAFGDSAATGSAAVAARRDHKHGEPTAAVTTSGLTQATGKLLGRTTASTGAIEELTAGAGLVLAGGTLSAPGGGSGGSRIYPLDTYTIDGTYGDDFTGSSLSGIWTRRNFASGDETYQVGPVGTYIRIAPGSRTIGDGYFQTSKSGDWTIGMAIIHENLSSVQTLPFGLAVIDSNGTGVATVVYTNPLAVLLTRITTYSTYQGTYVESANASTNPNINQVVIHADFKHWFSIRRDSGANNYYLSYSLNGEVWAPESGALNATFTPNRFGMIVHPLAGATVAQSRYDVDWFNVIA